MRYSSATDELNSSSLPRESRWSSATLRSSIVAAQANSPLSRSPSPRAETRLPLPLQPSNPSSFHGHSPAATGASSWVAAPSPLLLTSPARPPSTAAAAAAHGLALGRPSTTAAAAHQSPRREAPQQSEGEFFDAVFHMDSDTPPAANAPSATKSTPHRQQQQQHHHQNHHQSRTQEEPEEPALLPTHFSTTADAAAASATSELILARKNVELYNAYVRKDKELRETQTELSRLSRRLADIEAHIEHTIDVRVREARDMSAAEFQLQMHAARVAAEKDLDAMRSELVAEAGRVEVSRKELESVLRQRITTSTANAASPHPPALTSSRSREGLLSPEPLSSLLPTRVKSAARIGAIALGVSAWLACVLYFVLIVAALGIKVFGTVEGGSSKGK